MPPPLFLCVEFADKIFIFAVLERRLLQWRETKASFCFYYFFNHQVSVTRILRSALSKFRVYVCVCVITNFSQTTEPICIKIIPANRASYADCIGYSDLKYLLNTMNIVPARDHCCTALRQWQRITWRHRRNQCYHWGFQKQPRLTDEKTQKNPDNQKLISMRLN